MDQYFPLKFPRQGTRSVWLRNHTCYAGNPSDYPVVFGMWAAYLSLSVVFLTIVNQHVFEYSVYLGILSLILGFPGIYFAVKCFLTEPGIIPRGNILEAPADEEIVEEENQIRNSNVDKVIDIEKQDKIEQEIGQCEDKLQQEEEQQQLELQHSDSENNDAMIRQQTNNKEEQAVIDFQPTQSSDTAQVVAATTYAPSDNPTQDINPYENSLENHKNNEFTQEQIKITTTITPHPKLLQSRYCSTCCIMRPPMSSHCSSCNNCVKRFDHHCVFMGNCIGERNQSFFVLFLLSTSLWGLYVFSCTFLAGIHYSQQSPEPFYVLTAQPLIIASLLITGSLTFIACVLRCHSNLRNYSVYGFLLAVSGSVIFSGVKSETSSVNDNPVVLFYLSAVYLFVVVFVMPQACFNTMLAAKGSTLKFEKYQAAVDGEGRFPEESKPSWNNLVHVLCSKTVPSLVGVST